MTTTAPRTQGTQQFDQLFQRSRRRAYGLAYRLTGNAADAEDITQDAYLRAWHHFDQFDANRSFEGWLFRIITNRAIDLQRRRKRRPTTSIETLVGGEDDPSLRHEIISNDGNPEQIVLRPIREEQMAAALVALPDAYREVLLLYAIEQRSYQEIADTMRCACGTVRSRIHRARRMLSRTLEADSSALPRKHCRAA